MTYSFCFNTVPANTVDSVPLIATLDATDGYGGIKFAQVSGPNTASITSITPAFKNTQWEQSSQWAKGLVAGVYVFSATGTSATGITETLTDSITVLAALPAPTVTGIIITVFGVPLVIPSGQGTKITLSNGTTQTF